MSKQHKHVNAIYRMQQMIPDKRTRRTNTLVRLRRECVASIWAKSENERFWAASLANLIDVLETPGLEDVVVNELRYESWWML